MPAATVDEIGSTANSYQVLAKLATGGMAEIFLARSAGVAAVQRYVVLKRVLRERANDIQFVRMFLDEARLAAQLQHPNVAQVYDAGKLGDSYFFTMEYVHGETVRAVLQRAHERRMSPPLGCVLAIASGAAAGLHHAHTRIGVEGRPLGIVHRDVSPSNLMIGYDGSVKVVDFGVAKAADRISETQSGAVKGKISYLSPEQARGQKLDQRSDLFSLGIVMWEMLTVERLYKHESDYETMRAIIHEAPRPPSSRRRDIPRAMDALVMRALAKSPEARFQTAEELGEAIERVAVETSSPLSAAGLSRFLKELFGQRPEPWRTLGVAEEERAEIVTVTSEPIPQELQIPVNDPIDQRLAAVKDLSGAVSLDFDGPPVRPTASIVTETLAPAVTAVTEAVGPAAVGAVSLPGPAGVSWADTAVRFPPVVATAAAGQPRAAWWRRRRSGLTIGAVVLGVAVMTTLAVAFSSDDLPATTETKVVRPPAQAQVAAGVGGMETADATEAMQAPPAVAPPAQSGAGEPRPDEPAAGGSREPGELAAGEPPMPGSAASEPSATPPAEPTSETEAATAAAKSRPRATRATATPRKAIDLAREIEAGRHVDAVVECVANPAADRALCVRAACLAGDAGKARRWLARVATAQQGKLVDACAARGIKLAGDRREPKPEPETRPESKPKPEPKPKPDCEDPMDCPR